jgi:CubicO group peptidase (beta-lactamase class C family)
MTDNTDTNVRLSLMPHVLRLLLLMALIGCFPAYARTQPATFPGADWIQTTPEAQGVDSAKLQGAVEFLRANAPSDGVHELVIIRNGYLIWKGTGIDKRHGIWSCTKSFTSTVLGILVDDGKTTLDTKTATVLSSMSPAYPDVTFRHFTTMTSGYFAVGDDLSTHGQSGTAFMPFGTPLFTPSGSKYAYWDSAMNQFANALTRVANEPMGQLFKRRIADPIGMIATDWSWGNFGIIDGLIVNGGAGNSGMVEITARQMARLGHLFLHRGNWNGLQLISPSWVDSATKPQVSSTTPLGHPVASPFDGRGVYGFNWWSNGLKPSGARLWPGAPASTYSASGANNNDMFVIPDWGIVVVRLGLDEWSGFAITDATYSTFLHKIGQSVGVAPSPPRRGLRRPHRRSRSLES